MRFLAAMFILFNIFSSPAWAEDTILAEMEPDEWAFGFQLPEGIWFANYIALHVFGCKEAELLDGNAFLSTTEGNVVKDVLLCPYKGYRDNMVPAILYVRLKAMAPGTMLTPTYGKYAGCSGRDIRTTPEMEFFTTYCWAGREGGIYSMSLEYVLNPT